MEETNIWTLLQVKIMQRKNEYIYAPLLWTFSQHEIPDLTNSDYQFYLNGEKLHFSVHFVI